MLVSRNTRRSHPPAQQICHEAERNIALRGLEGEWGRSRYTRNGGPAVDLGVKQASWVAKDMGSVPGPPSRWSSLSGRRAACLSSAGPGSFLLVGVYREDHRDHFIFILNLRLLKNAWWSVATR